MPTLYDFLSSGNGYKCRLLLHQLGIALRAGRARHPQGRDAHARVPGQEPERQGPGAGARRRHRADRIQRDPVLPRRRHAVRAAWPGGAGAGAAVAVLRAVQPRAVHRRGALHPPFPATGQPAPRRAAPARAGRPRRSRRHGADGSPTTPSWSPTSYTIADIALYAYTHVADEGGFDLVPFPAVRAWLDRVAAQPGHVEITDAS